MLKETINSATLGKNKLLDRLMDILLLSPRFSIIIHFGTISPPFSYSIGYHASCRRNTRKTRGRLARTGYAFK